MRHDKNGFPTRSILSGRSPEEVGAAVAPSPVLSTSYVISSEVAYSAELFSGERFVYARWGNPTIHELEKCLADLDRGVDAVAYSTGMGAATSLLLHLLRSGDHLIVSEVCYPGVIEFSRHSLSRFGIDTTFVDMSDLEEVHGAIRDNTRVIWAETPCQPILKLTDIRSVAEIAHTKGIQLVVDSTIGTPIATRPLELGADFVLHSLTKYMEGHGDAMGGAVVSNRSLDSLRGEARHLGNHLAPFNAWLIRRGITTLPQRLAAHEAGALKVAQFLESQSPVLRVNYPGLESHPQHALARSQMQNFSGLMSFGVKNGERIAQGLEKRLQVIAYAVSLGKVRSLIFFISTAALQQATLQMTPERLERYREWAGDGVFRLSVGLEDPDDIIRDLQVLLGT